jgi:hypothetical protein
MTNLERYFGFRVEIDRILNPLTLRSLKESAVRFAYLKGFALDDFYVYVHHLYILQRSDGRGRQAIGEKLERLDIEFRVNPKQVRTNQILFFNGNLDESVRTEPNGVHPAFTEKLVLMSYDNEYLKANSTFHTRLITYISRDLVRSKFQKIKVQVTAEPTQRYHDAFLSRIEGPVMTQLDLRFNRDVQLRCDFDRPLPEHGEDEWLVMAEEAQRFLKELEGAQVLALVKEDAPRIEQLKQAIQRRDAQSLYQVAMNVGMHTVKFARDVGVNMIATVLTR